MQLLVQKNIKKNYFKPSWSLWHHPTQRTMASGGGRKQAGLVRLCGAEWWSSNGAESDCQCGLWFLPGREFCASKLSLIWPRRPSSTWKWSIHQWCELQGLYFQTRWTGDPSIICTQMAWVWGYQGWGEQSHPGTQWQIQRWWWVHGRWWKDWRSKLELGISHWQIPQWLQWVKLQMGKTNSGTNASLLRMILIIRTDFPFPSQACPSGCRRTANEEDQVDRFDFLHRGRCLQLGQAVSKLNTNWGISHAPCFLETQVSSVIYFAQVLGGGNRHATYHP